MTTVVYANGQLASDSRSTNRAGRVVDNRAIKLIKVDNITVNGVAVKWMGCAGETTTIDTLRRVLEKGSGEFRNVLAPYSHSLKQPGLSALLLLEDASCVSVGFTNVSRDNTGTWKLKLELPTDEFTAIGSGAKIATRMTKMFDIKRASTIAHIASKFDGGSGGQVYYVSPKDRSVRAFKGLSKITKAKVLETFEKLISS